MAEDAVTVGVVAAALFDLVNCYSSGPGDIHHRHHQNDQVCRSACSCGGGRQQQQIRDRASGAGLMWEEEEERDEDEIMHSS